MRSGHLSRILILTLPVIQYLLNTANLSAKILHAQATLYALLYIQAQASTS